MRTLTILALLLILASPALATTVHCATLHEDDMTTLDHTQKKLREARFFLEHLRTGTMPDPETFEFFLSAFLSAALGVRLALMNEGQPKAGPWIKAWQKQKENCSDEERKLLYELKEQRNKEHHQRGADMSIEWEPIPFIEYLTRTHDYFRVSWFGPIGTEPSHVKYPTSTFRLGSGKVEVVDSCARYFGLLERMVREFMAAHPS